MDPRFHNNHKPARRTARPSQPATRIRELGAAQPAASIMTLVKRPGKKRKEGETGTPTLDVIYHDTLCLAYTKRRYDHLR